VLESSFSNSASEQQVTVSVKVLDCDTVSQVKEKIIDTIYKTVPYSQRPTKDQRDLCMFITHYRL
jgi:plexin A